MRQQLEYVVPVWNPNYIIYVSMLESVQKQFFLRALRNLSWEDPKHLPSYESRCKLIELPSLQRRRDMISVMFLLKIIDGNMFVPFVLSKISFNVPVRNLRNFNLLRKNVSRITTTNYANFEPVNNIISIFNRYYDFIDFNDNYNTIKKLILS